MPSTERQRIRLGSPRHPQSFQEIKAGQQKEPVHSGREQEVLGDSDSGSKGEPDEEDRDRGLRLNWDRN
jgi:hypothetical protein